MKRNPLADQVSDLTPVESPVRATVPVSLARLLSRHQRWLVLTGAGCSTASGIPDYRDVRGEWKRPPPVDYRSFVSAHSVRQRYWARSLVGWRHFGGAQPNAAHRALADWEAQDRLAGLITQNVDGLHQAAGSRAVVDLHGRIDRVTCLRCERRWPRADFQRWLEAANPAWVQARAQPAPDGDAELDGVDFSDFVVPECPVCGGVLKPDVVFFGESVPPSRVAQAFEWLRGADGLLIVGSSLMLFSGFRFARAAAQQGLPLVAINQGRTRADALLAAKWEADCGAALLALTTDRAARFRD